MPPEPLPSLALPVILAGWLHEATGLMKQRCPDLAMQAAALTFVFAHDSSVGYVGCVVPPCSVHEMAGWSNLLCRPQEASVLAAHSVIIVMQGPM